MYEHYVPHVRCDVFFIITILRVSIIYSTKNVFFLDPW